MYQQALARGEEAAEKEEKEEGGEDDDADKEESVEAPELVLEGLREVLSICNKDVLPYLIPALVKVPAPRPRARPCVLRRPSSQLVR